MDMKQPRCELAQVFCLILLHLILCAAQDNQSGSCADGDIRLAGGPNEFEGRVEICFDGVWGQVCGRGWHREDGEVVCRQLGYIEEMQRGMAEASSGDNQYGGGDGPAFVQTVECTGTETRLDSCTYTRLNTTDECVFGLNALVVCTDPSCFSSSQTTTRLVGGSMENDGQIEVCSDLGFRTAVCDMSWDQNGAQTLCRELGLLQQGREAVPVYGNSTAQYKTYLNVSCTGLEASLSDCQTESTGERTCNPAGVVCPGTASPDTPTTTTTATMATINTTPTSEETSTMNTHDLTPVSTPTHVVPLETSTTDSSTVETTSSPTTGPVLSSTIIIILGVVGGMILVLLCGIMMLLSVLLITVRKQKKPQDIQNLNGTHKDEEKSLTNELYTMPTEDTLGLSDPRPYSSSSLSEEIHPYECAELEEIRSRARTGTFTSRRELTPSDNSIESIPAVPSPLTTHTASHAHSVPAILREITPPIPSQTNSESHVYAQPIDTTTSGAITDAEGYASLESPTGYDTIAVTAGSKKAPPNRYVLQPPPSEYQTPVYDKLVEAPQPSLDNDKQEYDVPAIAAKECDDETHNYDVPPADSPEPLDIMALGTNGQNPYAVLEHNIV